MRDPLCLPAWPRTHANILAGGSDSEQQQSRCPSAARHDSLHASRTNERPPWRVMMDWRLARSWLFAIDLLRCGRGASRSKCSSRRRRRFLPWRSSWRPACLPACPGRNVTTSSQPGTRDSQPSAAPPTRSGRDGRGGRPAPSPASHSRSAAAAAEAPSSSRRGGVGGLPLPGPTRAATAPTQQGRWRFAWLAGTELRSWAACCQGGSKAHRGSY